MEKEKDKKTREELDEFFDDLDDYIRENFFEEMEDK